MAIKLKSLGTVLCALCLVPTLYAATKTPSFQLNKYPANKNPLYQVVKQPGMIGIVPYYVVNGKVYVYLGQDLTGGKSETSGTYSDFGGHVYPNGTQLMQQALTEFKKETLGHIHLNGSEVVGRGYLLTTKTVTGQASYYVFVKLNAAQYKQTQKFHVANVRLKASTPHNSHFWKEGFAWVSLDDLLQQAVPTPKAKVEPVTEGVADVPEIVAVPASTRFIVQTPSGDSINILLQSYFLQECLQDPNLPTLIKQLSK